MYVTKPDNVPCLGKRRMRQYCEPLTDYLVYRARARYVGAPVRNKSELQGKPTFDF